MKTVLMLVIPAALGLATPGEAQAQVQVVVEPPSAFIATAAPEYFEGRPVYWYNDHWYYRDHGRWGYYRAEPGYLRGRRAHWVDRRGDYGRRGYVRPAYRGAWHPAPNRYRYRR
ncbi:MAG TPA: hypothetical protein VGF94_07600 [Kofleriaceae bacterium]